MTTRSELWETVQRGLRKCRIDDDAPIPLIKEGDLFHVTHMVVEELVADGHVTLTQ